MAFSLYGEKGSIFNSPDGTGFRIQRPAAEKPVELPIPDTGTWEDKPLPYFVSRLRDGLPFEGMTDARVARDAQEIVDAAKLSAARGREIRLPR
jgi:predicted dehydrogenase